VANENRTKTPPPRDLTGRVLHSGVSAVMALDLEGRFALVNARASEITGYSSTELMGKTYHTLMPPEAQLQFAEVFDGLVRGGMPSPRRETVMLRKDGARRSVACSTVPLYNEGRLYGIACTLEDITDLLKAEAQARLLGSVVVNAHDAVLISSAAAAPAAPETLYVNGAFIRLTGIEPTAALGRPPDALLRGAGVSAAAMEAIGADLAARRSAAAELSLQRAGGESCRVELNVFSANPPDGKEGHWIWNLRDVTERQRAAEALTASEERFRSLVQNSSDIITVLGENGAINYASPAVEKVLGLTPAALTGANVFDFIHPDDAPAIRAYFTRAREQPGTRVLPEFRVRSKAGGWVDLEAIGNRPAGPEGLRGIVINARDITGRKRAEQLERDRNRVLEMVAAGQPLRAILLELIALVERQRPGFRCLLSLPGGGSVAQSALASGLPDTPGAGASGESPAPACHSLPILSGAGNVLGTLTVFFGEFSDLDGAALDLFAMAARLAAIAIEQRQLADQLIYQAQHDILTGLPNRLLFEDRLRQALGQADRGGRMVALLFIDLDRFKQINDTLGHAAGDGLLGIVAQRLSGCIRQHDTLARLGGDEFILILSELSAPQDAVRIASKLLSAMQQPYESEGRELFLTASIGISVYPQDGNTSTALQRSADSAMYRAKSLGRNTFQCFAPEMNEAALERLEIETQLRRAQERGELALHYQPVVDMKDGRITGLEALFRWRHDRHGKYPSGQIIQLAEESGLIFQLGNWVMDEGCRQLREWRDAGLPEIKLAINISALQFAHFDFIELLTRVLDKHGIPPRQIELELTESMLMHDYGDAAAKLRKLRALGASVAIDDFGTGYSSLGHLQKLPIDTLKIDQSFIRGVESAANGAAIIRAITTMGHSLGMSVIAEGVETPEQLEIVRGVGCDSVQGYLYSRPVPAAEVAALLRAEILAPIVPGAAPGAAAE
jgi:diguanylate cyclase (GGDEF)-like protein/PAS domain S-box-containing protein